MTMAYHCPCCGRAYETTAMICPECSANTVCSCGERFCNRHQAEFLAKHKKTCDGWHTQTTG